MAFNNSAFVTPKKQGIPMPGFSTPSKSAVKRSPFDISNVPTPTKSVQSPSKMTPVAPDDIPTGTSLLQAATYNPFTPVAPLKVVLSPGSGHAVCRVNRKRKFEDSSCSLDGNMIDLESTSKRMREDDYQSVNVSELTVKIRRSCRVSADGNLGSKMIEYPIFETTAIHLKKMATPLNQRSTPFTRRSKLTPLRRAKGAHGTIRRSKRQLSTEFGTTAYSCPLKVQETTIQRNQM